MEFGGTKLICIIFVFITIQRQFSSSGLSTFGCLHETTLAVVLPIRSHWPYEISEVYDFLNRFERERCIKTVFVLDRNSMVLVQWSKDDRGDSFDLDKWEFLETYPTSIDTDSIVEFLGELHHDYVFSPNITRERSESTAGRRKVLLVVDYNDSSEDFSHFVSAIDVLHRETIWKVIISCPFLSYAFNLTIPFNRIVPGRVMILKKPNVDISIERLIHLVRNPNFNKFELLRRVSLNREENIFNIDCLSETKNNSIIIYIDIGKTNLLKIERNAEILFKIKSLADSRVKTSIICLAKKTRYPSSSEASTSSSNSDRSLDRSWINFDEDDSPFWTKFLVINKLVANESLKFLFEDEFEKEQVKIQKLAAQRSDNIFYLRIEENGTKELCL